MIVDRSSSGAEKGAAEGSVGEAWGAFAKALERSARAFILLLAIGLRPIFDSLRVTGSPTVVRLRGILSLLGLVAGLSIAVTSIAFYTVDIDAASARSWVDRSHGGPSALTGGKGGGRDPQPKRAWNGYRRA
jgi:hypothetical protein